MPGLASVRVPLSMLPHFSIAWPIYPVLTMTRHSPLWQACATASLRQHPRSGWVNRVAASGQGRLTRMSSAQPGLGAQRARYSYAHFALCLNPQLWRLVFPRTFRPEGLAALRAIRFCRLPPTDRTLAKVRTVVKSSSISRYLTVEESGFAVDSAAGRHSTDAISSARIRSATGHRGGGNGRRLRGGYGRRLAGRRLGVAGRRSSWQGWQGQG